MNPTNILILQNEIENVINKLVTDMNATDDEKIFALQLALSTAYRMKNTRIAYMTNLSKELNKEEKEESDGNKDEER